jgi:hypothetical protein
VTDLVKTLRTAPIALLALVLAVALVGTSCSSVDPVALQVGQWQLSSKDFQDQLDQFADARAEVGGKRTDLQGTTSETWSTTFTAEQLNYRLQFQLANLALSQRGLQVTDADRSATEAALREQASSGGATLIDSLPDDLRTMFIEGFSAQNVLGAALPEEEPSVEVLRWVYDVNVEQFDGQEFEVVKEGIAEVLKQNPEVLLEATLVELANQTDIYVDGRFGQFVDSAAQIGLPDGADQPAGADTSIEDLLGSTAQ